MTWAMVLGVCCGLVTAWVMAPWGSGPAPRRVGDVITHAPTPRRRGVPRRRRDALVDDLDAQRYLEALTRSVRAGRTLGQALDELARRQPFPPGPRLLHDALVAAARAGSRQATVLERGAASAADRVAARQERRAHAAQARLSATVLTWVPLGVASLAMIVDDHVREVMLTTPLGWTCLGLGVGLSSLGRSWIRRLTEGSPG